MGSFFISYINFRTFISFPTFSLMIFPALSFVCTVIISSRFSFRHSFILKQLRRISLSTCRYRRTEMKNTRHATWYVVSTFILRSKFCVITSKCTRLRSAAPCIVRLCVQCIRKHMYPTHFRIYSM
jgi:hypothetical protein